MTDLNGLIFTGKLSQQNGKTVNGKLVNSRNFSVSFGSAQEQHHIFRLLALTHAGNLWAQHPVFIFV